MLRVATWNLLHGRSTSDGVIDPDRLAAAAQLLDVDVLAIQEVDVGARRSGGWDQAAAVAQALGAGWHRFAAAVVGTPGDGSWRPADSDTDGAHGPRFGIALVSRLPVLASRVVRVPGSPVPGIIANPRNGRPVPLRDEPRALLVAELAAPWGPLRVAAAHLSFVPGWNLRQLVPLLREARPSTADGSALVLADTNIPGWLTRGLGRRWRMLAAVPTYPVAAPRVQFDHVLGRGPLPSVATVQTPLVGVGDHRPVVVTLEGR